MLRSEEGVSNTPYQDHLGYWTIGVGHLMDPRKGGSLPAWARTELDKQGFLSDDSINKLLKIDVEEKLKQIELNIPWASSLDPVRFNVLLDMTFQMGIGGVLGFKNTLRYIEQGSYNKAAENMRQSLWYRQTPNRAKRRIEEMITGEYHKYV